MNPALDRAPAHGFRGDAPAGRRFPRTLTVALSREPGARGAAVARRLGRALGWQVVDQELLDYMAQDPDTADDFTQAGRLWAEAELDRLTAAGAVSADPQAQQFARSALTLGARGECVLLGRGAGYLLPPASTLHVRVVDREAERAAYLQQALRLTEGEALDLIAQRDEARRHYLDALLGTSAYDPYPYDLVVHVGRLGEAGCAAIIAEAAKAKLHGVGGDDPRDGADPV